MPFDKVIDSAALDAGMTATADAIRAKTGSADAIPWDSQRGFADAVEGIEAGRAYSEGDDVCFWDYDGTLLYSCTLAEAQAMTALPEPPDHSQDDIPLTFVEWNHTLDELHAVTWKADVGATYKPTDDKTHFFLRITNKTGLTATVNYSYHSDLTVDWGDGTVDTIAGKSDNNAFTHDYAECGTYHVSVVGTGNPGGTKGLVADKSMLVGKLVIRPAGWEWPNIQGQKLASESQIESVVISGGAPTGTELFSNCRKLRHLNVPYAWKKSPSVSNCSAMKHISLSGAAVSTEDYGLGSQGLERVCLPDSVNLASCRFTFRDGFSLREVRIPSATTSIPARAFLNCYNLKDLIIPSTVTNINSDTTFSNAGILDYYLHSTTPPTLGGTSAFTGIKNSTVIHVPAVALEDYKTATNWATYADYMVGDL